MDYHHIPLSDLLKELDTDPDAGLTGEEAASRLSRTGPNALPEPPGKPLIIRFFQQFADFMIFVLFAAAGLSFAVSCYEGHPDYLEPAIILAIIVLNAILGVFQESRAEHSLAALKKLSTPKTRVIRDGRTQFLPCGELVPGDVILLETGQFIPADARLLTAVNLTVQEASLTGESVPSEKDAHSTPAQDAPTADWSNCVFSSCVVANGHGTAVVTATGLSTEIGKIAKHLMSGETPPTPLQKRLASVGKMLGFLCLLICAAIFFLGTLQGRPPVQMLMTAVSLAVAAIPEGLPAVVTIMLSIGVERMAKQNAVIRKLPAVETLGSATYICTDKTGTLTQNRMTAVACFAAGHTYQLPKDEAVQAVSRLLLQAALCCNSDGTTGEPTENALVAAASRLPEGSAASRDAVSFQRLLEVPFQSSRKCMLVVGREADGKYLLIAKGAPDVLLAQSTHAYESGSLRPIQPQSWLRQNQSYAQKALRVLAVATRQLSAEEYEQALREKDEEARFRLLCRRLSLQGLIALWDPPRPECAQAVAECEQAGIATVMITGDHPDTAKAIAEEIGIGQNSSVVTGTMLSRMDDETLQATVKTCRVYARVQPEHKVRIVQALQAQGEVVAMTGDGVNDAPALRSADIGCAMGITGTDVAKSAADMILMDDNFATIISAVREGRGIYDNIRKAIHFLLSCNAGEILLIVLCILFRLPSPLVAIQLLWINLVTDSFPAIALALEPPEPDIMKRKPETAGASLFDRARTFRLILEGCMIGMLSFLGFLLYGTTCCFLVLGFSELIHTLNIKNDRSLFTSGLFENPFLTVAILTGILLQFVIVSVPVLAGIFAVAPLSAAALRATVLLSLVPLLVVEIEKHFFRDEESR